IYEKELADFQAKVRSLKSGDVASSEQHKLAAASIHLLTSGVERFDLKEGQRVFTDQKYAIKTIAPELAGLSGIRISSDKYEPIEFESAEPVKVLVGYFQAKGDEWRRPPDLETDAQAIERGDVEPLPNGAVTIE